MLKIMSMELEEASETIAPELPSLTGDAYAEALHVVHENNIGVFAIFSRAGLGQFVISSCNTLFCELTGYSREELEGYNIQQLFEPRTCMVLKQHLSLCLQQAGRLHFEETLYTDTGVHILTGNLVPIADDQGRSRGILLMATTQPESQERINGENGLAYIEEAFNRLLSAGSNTMCILDDRGICNYLSTNWKRLTGYDQEECIGRSFLHFVHPEDRAAFSRAAHVGQDSSSFPHSASSGGNSTIEYRLLHADGRWHWHEADITVRHDVDSGTDSSRFVNISRDITDHKHTQEQLHKAQLATELANRSRAEFLSNMSHELRTPLNAIIGFSEFMRNEMGGPVYNPTYLEYLNDIYESGHSLLGIINNVLEASSIEHGEAFLREEDADIVPLVKQAIELQFGQALRARVTVKTQLFEQPLMVRVDPVKFRQAICHILSNAIKFTPEQGTVVIRSTVTSSGDLLLTVTDTGVGIPHEKIERILSPFELVDASFSKKKSGAGLGLPLARSFIKMHGGMLSIESTEGYGTQVSITLPSYRLALASNPTTQIAPPAERTIPTPISPRNYVAMSVPAQVAPPPPSPSARHEAWRDAWQEAVTQQHSGSPFANTTAEEEAPEVFHVEPHADLTQAEVIAFSPPPPAPSISSAMEDAWLAAWERAVALQDNQAPVPESAAVAASAAAPLLRAQTIDDNPDHPLHRGWTD